jgi:serine protease
MSPVPRAALAALFAAASAIASSAHGAERLIVKLTPDSAKALPSAKARIDKLARIGGVPLRHLREMARGADVVIADTADAAATDRLLARLAKDPGVAFAQRDVRRHALQATNPPVNDLFAPQQRYLANNPTAISAFAAWDVTHGSPNIVVAVVDTGYQPQPGLAGRILPGYDMISFPDIANDGDGRDADALDTGDAVTPADLANLPQDCEVRRSSWHGTGVAGIIAANTNDGAWTAGIDWAAKILPVRVLGRCGGFDSDIADAIAWAGGLTVPGVPTNPTPAQVINLSLGGPGSCAPVYQGLADAVYARGYARAIVASAGNDGGDVADDSPANCPGFMAIASTTGVSGSLANFSNSGPGILISAPGGAANFRTPADSVIVLSNTGLSAPDAYTVVNEGGTSVSAPMVSATISLMLSVAPTLGPDAIASILAASAKPFPSTSNCTTDTCGAGILDTGAAVRMAASAAPATVPNYEGLWWAAPAGSESGWGINFAHQRDIIFATWFTYDGTGNAWWLSMTANKVAPDVYAGDLVQTHGPAFSAMPFDPNAVTHASVGEASLTFIDANTAQFAYTVNGVSQTKTLTREIYGIAPRCTFGAQPDLAVAGNFQDLWWASPAGAESGWGINLTEQSNVIFGTWFTYDVDGTPLWLSVTANSTSPNVYSGALVRTRGPAFGAVPFDPAAVTRSEVGTATFTFTDGNHATFAYTVGNVSQSKPITREVFVSPGTTCQ